MRIPISPCRIDVITHSILSFCLFVRHCINSDLFASRITLYVIETWPAAPQCLLTLTPLVPRLCITLPPFGISFPLLHSISWSCILCLWTVFFYPAVGLDFYSHCLTGVFFGLQIDDNGRNHSPYSRQSHSLLGYILWTIRKENTERVHDSYALQVHSTVWGHFYT